MSARILVVDDLEANRRLLEAMLTADYYEVLMATRGEEGVQLAKREKPDLILMDVMMPGGIDGYEACRRLRQLDDLAATKVILVSGGVPSPEYLGGPPTDGIGFALGVDRTLLACDAEGVFPAPARELDAFVVDLVGGMARDSGLPNLFSCCNIRHVPKLMEDGKPARAED